MNSARLLHRREASDAEQRLDRLGAVAIENVGSVGDHAMFRSAWPAVRRPATGAPGSAAARLSSRARLRNGRAPRGKTNPARQIPSARHPERAASLRAAREGGRRAINPMSPDMKRAPHARQHAGPAAGRRQRLATRPSVRVRASARSSLENLVLRYVIEVDDHQILDRIGLQPPGDARTQFRRQRGEVRLRKL